MYDELTAVDIKKMQEEIEYRESVLMPKLRAELKRTREFGDLSENAEYKEAKREKRRCEGRIRYLNNMIRTARIIETDSVEGKIGLFDWVVIYNEARGEEKRIQIVTTLRQDAIRGFISKESPLGQALMGRRAGERVTVTVAPGRAYDVTIRSVERGEDNEALPISGY